MNSLIDLTGQRFGRLTVLEMAEKKPYSKAACWSCVCDCGKKKTVLGTNLRNGTIRSCGCLSRDVVVETHTKHGKSNTRLYRIWRGMIDRCEKTNSISYENYGGRGITICKEWRDDVGIFSKWAMENGYEEGLSLDRIDNDEGYFPKNCRWSSSKEQANNRRTNYNIVLNGEKKTLSEWCEELQLNYKTVKSRIHRSWTIEEALELVPRKKT